MLQKVYYFSLDRFSDFGETGYKNTSRELERLRPQVITLEERCLPQEYLRKLKEVQCPSGNLNAVVNYAKNNNLMVYLIDKRHWDHDILGVENLILSRGKDLPTSVIQQNKFLRNWF